MAVNGALRTAKAWLALALVAALTTALLAGLLYTVVGALSGDTGATEDVPAGNPAVQPEASASLAETTAPEPRDELAAAPMLQLAPSAARPQPLVTETAGPPIPLPTATDDADIVPSGFPRTPEGALAQLAAIDTLALRDLDLDQLQRVYDWAALPGAVPFAEWTPAVAATAALAGAGTVEASADLASTFTPVAGQIKGVVGKDFVVACVLGEWQVSYREISRAGAGDCQRMVWTQGRWWIGPGDQPAYAPSAWPGSADAVRAGWRTLTDA